MQKRIEKLRCELDRHRYAYYVLDAPEISDQAYDSLFEELLNLEKLAPEFFSPTSPTQRVGAEPLKNFKKVRHAQQQWSFDDVFDFEELVEWDAKVRRMIEKSNLAPSPVQSTGHPLPGGEEDKEGSFRRSPVPIKSGHPLPRGEEDNEENFRPSPVRST